MNTPKAVLKHRTPDASRDSGRRAWPHGKLKFENWQLELPLVGRATVLGSKLKVRIFEQVIEEGDEFTHDGRERHFGGFAFAAEVLIKAA